MIILEEQTHATKRQQVSEYDNKPTTVFWGETVKIISGPRACWEDQC